MIKQIVVCGTLVGIFSYGSAFGVTSMAKCCSGTRCVTCAAANENNKSCLTDFDCGGGGVASCPDECPNADWTDVSTTGIAFVGNPTYQTRCQINLLTNTGTCQYQCGSGSYGSPTSSSSGCSRCPERDGKPGISFSVSYGESAAGSKNITDCYMAAGDYKDSTGTYKITDDCYYTN